MSTWNYRVVRHEHDEELEYQIHEVYYDGAGQITMWSQNAIAPSGTNPAELASDLRMMTAATEQPVLNVGDLPGAR